MTACRCAIGTAALEYELSAPDPTLDLDEYLTQRWLGSDVYEAVGYRTLATWFNTRIVQATYWAADYYISPAREATDLELLTGGRCPARTDRQSELRALGIDVDHLLERLISRQTMYTHLRGCLDLEKAPAPAATDWQAHSIEIVRENSRERTQKALTSLQRAGAIADDAPLDVTIDILAACPICTTTYPVEAILSRGYACPEHRHPTEADEDGRRTPPPTDHAAR